MKSEIFDEIYHPKNVNRGRFLVNRFELHSDDDALNSKREVLPHFQQLLKF